VSIPRPLLLFVALAGLACGGDALAPVDGVLEVVLTSTTATPGAIVFLVQGAAVDSIEGVGYYTASAPSGAARRVLIAGDRLSGRLALVHVPDAATSYQVVVQEAADRGTYALLAPPEVRLELRRVYR
jgi:hypothetical protein